MLFLHPRRAFSTTNDHAHKAACAGSISPITAWSMPQRKIWVSVQRDLASTPARAAARVFGAARLGRHIDPDQPVLLAHRIGTYPDFARIQVLALNQRGNGAAHPALLETPAMIGAFHRVFGYDLPADSGTPRWGQISRRANNSPICIRPITTGSPSSISRRILPGQRRRPAPPCTRGRAGTGCQVSPAISGTASEKGFLPARMG